MIILLISLDGRKYTMSTLKYRIAGYFFRISDRKGRFEDGVSLVQISIQENILLEKLKDLTEKAKSLIADQQCSETDSVELLRSIFFQLKNIKRQLKQHRSSRDILNKHMLRKNYFMQAMKQNYFMEQYCSEKLQHHARASTQKFNKKALRLKLERDNLSDLYSEMDCNSDVEDMNEEENEDEDSGFSCWLQELVKRRDTSGCLEELLLSQDVTVKELEERLKTLRATYPVGTPPFCSPY